MHKYEETAQIIIKEAIKSAIFIDENAKEPFMQEEPAESKRSEDLYKNFKENGISLTIYKYDDNTLYKIIDEYFFPEEVERNIDLQIKELIPNTPVNSNLYPNQA